MTHKQPKAATAQGLFRGIQRAPQGGFRQDLVQGDDCLDICRHTKDTTCAARQACHRPRSSHVCGSHADQYAAVMPTTLDHNAAGEKSH